MREEGQRGGYPPAGERAAGLGEEKAGQGGTGGLGAQGAPLSRPVPAVNPLAAEPVEFVGSFPDFRVRLDPPLPEIAFIGRSNVGKSSLLNALVGRPGLARVSGSPGKTTLLNFYRRPRLYLVDLPGYGYARSSKRDRAGYRKLIIGYLETRQTLAGVVWLLDIRRDLSPEDQQMRELLTTSGRPVLPVLTKADKLTRSALGTRQRELAHALDLEPEQVAVTSSRTGTGIPELANSVLAAALKENS